MNDKTTEQTAPDDAPKMNCKSQTVFIGDNLPIMRGLNSGIADLIYLDPPWNFDVDHNNLYETPENKELGYTA